MSGPEFDFGLTFDELRRANAARRKQIHPQCKDWIISDWAMAVAGEVGELCNKIKKARRGDPVSQTELADELADVVIYLDIVAAELGIDLGRATREKFNVVSRRFDSDVTL